MNQKKDPPPEFSRLGKTVSLLLRMSKPIYGTAKVLILDSGFCVVEGITQLLKKGVYSAALIKKRRYWPKYIRGDDIKQHFENKRVGSADAWRGFINNEAFSVHSMKEPDYVMSIMTTYGTLSREGCRETTRRGLANVIGNSITFKYPEVINNHFRYRHAVDDHNSKRHQPISLEVTWATKWWPNRVFAFLLAITEVNVMLAAVAFTNIYNEQPSMIDFRKRFARDLINNDYLELEKELKTRQKRACNDEGCKLVRLPKRKNFRCANGSSKK